MDNAEIKFHQMMLRLARGMCSAYADWLDEVSVTAMADELKKVRQQQQSREARVLKVDLSGGNE